MNSIGLYANDPDDGEILYAVAGANVGAYMPPYNGITVSGAYLKLVTTVSNASNVSMTVDPAAVATVGDINALQAEITDIQSYIGYTDADIYGVEVDFKNKKFTRLAGAVGKTPGDAFDGVKAFGGRKRCNVTDEGKVVAMDSFETPNNQQTGTVPTPPVPYPDNRPVRPQRLERMSDNEFSLFYKKVKDEPFSDEKDDMIRALSGSKRLTCKQCAQLLDFYSFSDEKLNVVRLFAPNIVDKENYKDIQKKFSSYFDKEDVKKIIGI